MAACLDAMDGEDAAKEMRLRAVVDDAIAESRARGMAHPSLGFVFHPKHVRRRLERLAEAEHLAQKAAETEGADKGRRRWRAELEAAQTHARARGARAG